MAVLTRKDIVDNAIAVRFSENDRSFLNWCLDQRYRELWNLARWDFRFTTPVAFTVTADRHQQDLASVVDPDTSSTLRIGSVSQVWYDPALKEPLEPVTIEEFWRLFPIYTTPAPSSQRGTPQVFTYGPYSKDAGGGSLQQIERLFLGPAPTSASTIYMVIERAYVPMDTETAVPRIPEEYHPGLIIGLLELATKLRGDRTWVNYRGEWERVLGDIIDNHVAVTDPPVYGMDPL